MFSDFSWQGISPYFCSKLHNMKADAEEFLEKSEHYPVVDVRSPAEFQQGHIPGAHNIPLFTNEERAAVGTLYKNSGKYAALLKGLDFVGPKMSDFVKKVVALARDKKLLVHCWRGGMRSESMAWLFSRAGIETIILRGGYKAYRKHIRSKFEQDMPLVIVGGMTGSGKTELLHYLAKTGHQVIDLEGRAHHKGSAFGAIGQTEQPTSEQFENDLAAYWKTLSAEKPVFIEDESRSIGSVSLPEPLFFQMRRAPVIKIEIPKPHRIQRLVREYAKFENEKLKDALVRIHRRLGGQNEKEAILALENQDYEKVAEITLGYYDKAYKKGLSKRETQSIYPLALSADNPEENARQVLSFYQEKLAINGTHIFRLQRDHAG